MLSLLIYTFQLLFGCRQTPDSNLATLVIFSNATLLWLQFLSKNLTTLCQSSYMQHFKSADGKNDHAKENECACSQFRFHSLNSPFFQQKCPIYLILYLFFWTFVFWYLPTSKVLDFQTVLSQKELTRFKMKW